jgi:uncharacterized protein with HEPN domain
MPFTRSKSPIDALTDILHNIRLATDFAEGMSYDAFCADPRTVYAVTRCLEIISEASRRLPKQLKARHADIPWTDIAGAGSVFGIAMKTCLSEFFGTHSSMGWRR